MGPVDTDNAEVTDVQEAGASTRTKILAYLGELRPGQFVSATTLINDLDLRFTTAKNTLTKLELQWIVEKRIKTARTVTAEFRISPTATMPRLVGRQAADLRTAATDSIPFVPPEWNDAYGKRPSGV